MVSEQVEGSNELRFGTLTFRYLRDMPVRVSKVTRIPACGAQGKQSRLETDRELIHIRIGMDVCKCSSGRKGGTEAFIGISGLFPQHFSAKPGKAYMSSPSFIFFP